MRLNWNSAMSPSWSASSHSTWGDKSNGLTNLYTITWFMRSHPAISINTRDVCTSKDFNPLVAYGSVSFTAANYIVIVSNHIDTSKRSHIRSAWLLPFQSQQQERFASHWVAAGLLDRLYGTIPRWSCLPPTECAGLYKMNNGYDYTLNNV